MTSRFLKRFVCYWCGALVLIFCFALARNPRNVSSLVPAAVAAGPMAPEFPTNAAWINTARPLSLRALRGKIVLLDFWTYGCINCMHILPDLKKLERKYPNELVIISVHSAKFANEDETSNIRNAALRYNIEHPVLNDSGMRVWEAYGVNAWPTLVLIDPDGRIAGGASGEGNYDYLDKNIGNLIKQFGATGKLNATPLKFALEAAKIPDTPLWHPGKVLASATLKRLFIADSNHNRIVITDLNGNVEAVAGSGEIGFKDGAFDEATFSNPQGMSLSADENTLYLADTNNHAIRALDLKKGTVSTIAGTGRQAAWRSTGGVGTSAALASPWDVLTQGDTLYIAMAGPHQIWRMNLSTQQVDVFAGTGREARTDGNARNAAFAQPSGLSTDGKQLFIADSESSSVRAVDLPAQSFQGLETRTLAGGGMPGSDLFQFGDMDGRGTSVRLQHPLGVAFTDGKLFIADTYNHKIKVLEVAGGEIRTFAGGGRGLRDGRNAQFYEPGGISIANNKLYVADTNNHAVRVVDLATKSTSTLQLKNVPPALPAEPQRALKPVNPEAGTIVLPVTKIAPHANGQVVLDAVLPKDHHLNNDAPQRLSYRTEGNGLELAKVKMKFALPLTVPFRTGSAGTRGAVVVSATINYCTDSKGLCKIKSLRFRAPYEIAEGGATKITLPAKLN